MIKKKKKKSSFPQTGQEIRCQEVISSEMKEENAKEPRRENIKVTLFFPLCIQIDRKIIAVIADSFSPKIEWP